MSRQLPARSLLVVFLGALLFFAGATWTGLLVIVFGILAFLGTRRIP